MNRPVKHVQMHAVPFVEGAGQLKTTLSLTNYSGMKMMWTSDGVVVDYPVKNTLISFIIPPGNIIVATFSGPEESQLTTDGLRVPKVVKSA